MSTTSAKRVTLKDVGRATGYHCTTVGLALNDSPRIPVSTRLKIKKVAGSLGYHSDPAMRALVVHRHGLTKPLGFSTIAVISDYESADGWRSVHPTGGAEYFLGMTCRAKALGYQLEEFTVDPDHHRQKELDRMLKKRDISALIITPQQQLDLPIQLDWKAFTSIAIGFSLCDPPLPRVTHQHRAGSQLAVESLMRLGYRKMAFLNPYAYEVRVGFGYSAGYFGMVNLHRDLVRSLALVPKDTGNLGSPETIRWYKQHKPEVIITSQDHLLGFFRKHGIRIPQDVGFVKLGVKLDENNQVSGIYENSPTVGEEAVNLIAQLQSSNIRGYPPICQVHLVQGEWIPGTTVRKVGKSLL